MRGRLTRERLRGFLERLDERLDGPARLYLCGEASLVIEGEREWTDRLVYVPGSEALERAIRALAEEAGVALERESPAEVVPLPAGSEGRSRRVAPWPGLGASGGPGRLGLFHFDPCGTALRLVARGDEADYHAALCFLRLGFTSLEEMDRLLRDALPRFSAESLHQDPEEFRRKYKGLRQMWRASGG